MNTFYDLFQACFGCADRITFLPFAVVSGQTLFPDRCSVKINAGKFFVYLAFEYGNCLKEHFFIRMGDGEMNVERSLRNTGGSSIELNELGIELGAITFGGDPADDYFYHVENPRMYNRMAIGIDLKRSQEIATSSEYDTLAGTRWADPGVVSERIGASPYQPFPAILLSNHGTSKGLIHGTLSQRVFFHNYLVKHSDSSIRLDILSSFKAIAHLNFASGTVLKDSWYLGLTEDAVDLQKCFDRYTAALRKKLPPLYGATNINRHSLTWGSWNDGVMRAVTQEKLLKTAAFLTEHFPTVEWLQLDDGYSVVTDAPHGFHHGLGMPYEGEAGVAKHKFPDGLKAYANEVRQTGLRPAVWIGGAVPDIAPLAKDHPEWFVDYSYRTPTLRMFDVSKPEVREYMCRALDYFVQECGFDAIKHDFWSYVFEDSHPLLANKDCSGYQWRDWWLKEIRKRLPADGYLQTGCDIVMGNPFLGEFFTNYRYGIDAASGNWEHVTTTMLWGAACFALHIGDLIVPNSDSLGLFPGLSDVEAMVCVNYCLVSRSMVEIAGWLYDMPKDNPRLKALKKAVCCPNNGQNVYFAGYSYRKTDKAPSVWYFKGPFFSLLEDNPHLPLRAVALFNIQDTPQNVGFGFAELGLPEGKYILADVWDRDCVVNAGHGFSVEMPPHSSRLFAVSRNVKRPQLLDANVKVDRISVDSGVMQVTLAHKGHFEFRLTHRPIAARFDGQAVELKVVAAGCGYVVEGVGSNIEMVIHCPWEGDVPVA